jgi:FkbM family methyltransferase
MKQLLNWVENSLISYKNRRNSYSQSGEDLIIEFIFKNVLGQKNFKYLDIGAHHPIYLSNTALFYKSGMNGVCVEPDPLLHAKIERLRPRDICLNVGIGFSQVEDSQEDLDFYIMSTRTLNTFSKEEAERLHKQGTYKIVGKVKIPVIHIHKIFKSYFVPDLLSIDVEGIDFEIVKSIDFNRFRPKVLCVETAEFSPLPPGTKTQETISFIQDQDYMAYGDTFNNTIFIDSLYLNDLHERP